LGLQVLRACWPAVHALAALLPDDEVASAVCDLITYVLRVAMTQAASALEEMAQTLATAYALRPRATLLEAGVTLFAVFGKEARHQPALAGLFHLVNRETLAVFQSGSVAEHPDLVEQFFHLLARGFRGGGLALCTVSEGGADRLDVGMVMGATQWALAALTLAELPTVKAAAQALVVLIEFVAQEPACRGLMLETDMAQVIVARCVEGLAGGVAKASLQPVASVLWTLRSVRGHRIPWGPTGWRCVSDTP
jgi:hypothetical protein